MRSPWTDSSQTPVNGTELNYVGVLINHEGRIASLETTREASKEARARFEIKDLISFLPGLIALLLALLGKISWLQYLGATGLGR